MYLEELPPISERSNVTPEVFRSEIEPTAQPCVLRNLVGNWPVVQEAKKGPKSVSNYLKQFDNGQPMGVVIADPEVRGKLFYNSDLSGLNFKRGHVPFSPAIEQILRLIDESAPPTVFIESSPIKEHLPNFVAEHSLPLVPAETEPRIWIGNKLTVHTHADMYSNIACVVAGQRRFTLFPPEQLPNLYVGPLDFTPSGPPVSMAPIDPADFEAYPKFKQALNAAKTAVLQPGDAIYIPYNWWHCVQSLTPFNILVNYWWDVPGMEYGNPLDAMLHAALTIRRLPPSMRDVWRVAFEHYIFETEGNPVEHLPNNRHGFLGELSPEHANKIREILRSSLAKSYQ